MKIIDLYAIEGPNIFHHDPVMIMKIDLQGLRDTESKTIPNFNERLVALLPGLKSHYCSRGHEGGFLERLTEGTYFGHIIEHVALELTEPAGLPSYFGKTLYGGKSGLYTIAISYQIEELSRYVLRAAVTIVENALQGSKVDLEGIIKAAREIAYNFGLGPSTKALLEAAKIKGIPCRRRGDGSLIQLGYGKRRKYLRATETWNTKSIAVDIACDKALTKILLNDAGLPVPGGKLVDTLDEALEYLSTREDELAVKPCNSHHGLGVSLNVATPEEMRAAFLCAQEYSDRVLIEEMLQGRDYRVLVVDGRVVAASERIPPQVSGNGVSSIQELVAEANCNPERGIGHQKHLSTIALDDIALAHLARKKLSTDAIPEAGEVVTLRGCGNLSCGGIAKDVTDLIHQENARICERAAEAVGLDVCGVDLLADDIAQPLGPHNGIVEVNAAPGIRMHEHPSIGPARNVAKDIVESLYPTGEDGRIPIIALTGTNGKTTVARMLRHVFSGLGLTVGMTTTGGVWVGDERIMSGDTTGPASARAVLANPQVEIAVLETARGGIVRNGLAYDWSDVAIITNIQPDHIGQDGIESEDDLLFIKSLIAERVREGGTIVLNALDPRLARLSERRRISKIKRNIVYFAVDPKTHAVHEHIEEGGTAYFISSGWIVEAAGKVERPVAPIDVFPITMGGIAVFQIENVLAALAGCRALGVGLDEVTNALSLFSVVQNPGRANLYQVKHGQVLVDYGHNPGSFHAVYNMVSQWQTHTTGIVGVPGDRSDTLIRQAGAAAAECFEKIIIKEDKDLRGRSSGEVARLLSESIKDLGGNKSVDIVLDERQALEKAIEEMKEEETVIIFYENLGPILATLEKYGAKLKENPWPKSDNVKDAADSRRVGLTDRSAI